jgi:predicted cobalt transporter CbtA
MSKLIQQIALITALLVLAAANVAGTPTETNSADVADTPAEASSASERNIERWEYIVVEDRSLNRIRFNELGAEGWELVAIQALSAYEFRRNDWHAAVFKRRLP